MDDFIFLDNIYNNALKSLNLNIVGGEKDIKYKFYEKKLMFPYRVYNDDICDNIENFDLNQRIVLHCIYSRHYNGFIRQKQIENLLSLKIDFSTIPFIFKVCDEYVLEILNVVYSTLKNRDNSDFKKFCNQNQLLVSKSYARMVSYWNEYYRDCFPDIDMYVGKKIFVECFEIN